MTEDKQFKSEVIKKLLESETSKAPEEEVNAFQAADVRWHEKTTKLLLDLYSEDGQNFRNPKFKKNSLWIKISKKMKEHGYSFTPEMCDNKFRNMKVTYKKIKDNMRKTGRPRQHWDYFDIMENIFKDDAGINPPLLLSSLRASPLPKSTSCNSGHLVTITEPQPSTSNSNPLEIGDLTRLASNITDIMPSTSGYSTESPEIAGIEIEPLKSNVLGVETEAKQGNRPKKSTIRDIQNFRKKILENEDQKLQTLQEISNTYKAMLEAVKERNSLLREYLNKENR